MSATGTGGVQKRRNAMVTFGNTFNNSWSVGVCKNWRGFNSEEEVSPNRSPRFRLCWRGLSFAPFSTTNVKAQLHEMRKKFGDVWWTQNTSSIIWMGFEPEWYACILQLYWRNKYIYAVRLYHINIVTSIQYTFLNYVTIYSYIKYT